MDPAHQWSIPRKGTQPQKKEQREISMRIKQEISNLGSKAEQHSANSDEDLRIKKQAKKQGKKQERSKPKDQTNKVQIKKSIKKAGKKEPHNIEVNETKMGESKLLKNSKQEQGNDDHERDSIEFGEVEMKKLKMEGYELDEIYEYYIRDKFVLCYKVKLKQKETARILKIDCTRKELKAIPDNKAIRLNWSIQTFTKCQIKKNQQEN